MLKQIWVTINGPTKAKAVLGNNLWAILRLKQIWVTTKGHPEAEAVLGNNF